MNIGVCLPTSGATATPENLEQVARWCEELGYHSVWVTDHVVLPEHVNSYYPYEDDHRWPFPADTNWLDPLLALSLAGRVAEIGDGWHPTQVTLDELEAGIRQIEELCGETGRDAGSLRTIARPHTVYPITAETQARHRELGVTDVVIDPPTDLDACRAELERIAAVTDLEPRT